MSSPEPDPPRWYLKRYTCDCGTQWEDEWDCLCNDRCPNCNAEIECDGWEELTPESDRFPIST